MLPAYLDSDAALDQMTVMAKVWPLTVYETAVVVANRAQALAQGSRSKIAVVPDMDVIDTARSELLCGALPPTRVLRYLPNEACVAVNVHDVHRSSTRHR
jgi:DNA-directed RNA polymerase subunit K/omega